MGSREEVFLINESFGKTKVGGELTKEEEDVFWTVAVLSGCRWASDLTNSEAGVPILFDQTLKDESERIAAPDVI